jgi:hypothetical protein
VSFAALQRCAVVTPIEDFHPAPDLFESTAAILNAPLNDCFALVLNKETKRDDNENRLSNNKDPYK